MADICEMIPFQESFMYIGVLFIYVFINSLPRVIVQPKLVLHEPCITNIEHIKIIQNEKLHM